MKIERRSYLSGYSFAVGLCDDGILIKYVVNQLRSDPNLDFSAFDGFGSGIDELTGLSFLLILGCSLSKEQMLCFSVMKRWEVGMEGKRGYFAAIPKLGFGYVARDDEFPVECCEVGICNEDLFPESKVGGRVDSLDDGGGTAIIGDRGGPGKSCTGGHGVWRGWTGGGE